MQKNSSYIIEPLSLEALINNIDRIPRDFFTLFEYRSIETQLLKANLIENVTRLLDKEANYSISIHKNGLLIGFLILEYMPYDSEIFEFKVYRLANIVLLGKNEKENTEIIKALLNRVEEIIFEKNITYLTVSLNANILSANIIFNVLMKYKFYYINTLITFKMEKNDYQKVRMYKPKNDDVIIRLAKKEDKDALFDIANKSYKINRFHLDNNLDNRKCDFLHAKSVENSILHGFADVIFVAEYKKEIVGYYSGKKYNDDLSRTVYGSAIISAVSEKARGLGIFSLMNNALLEWFATNTDISEMGTYITNAPVHKTWTNNGLNVVRCSHQLAFYNSSEQKY